jgi:TetR/AcrR family transcriptional regulator
MNKRPALHDSTAERRDRESLARAPKTQRGKERVIEILAAAKALFIHGGYAEMTMRRISDRVGISLSNVQHYFPTREALLQGLLNEVMTAYDPAYAEVTEGITSAKARLEAVIRYLINDARNPETEKLFVEIWSVATRDDMARGIVDQMYTHHRRNIESLIAAANPSLSNRQVCLRAALIAMQIEGLMLLISDAKPKHAELAGIEAECVTTILRIVEAP